MRLHLPHLTRLVLSGESGADGAFIRKAIHEAHLTGKERVIDAYCGTGTIGIIAAKNAGEVIGVELNRDAIRDAVTNAKRNDIRNIRFYNDDAGKFMVEMAQMVRKRMLS